MELNDEQKRKIIEEAQYLYRQMLDARRAEDPVANEVDYYTLKEACRDMSFLVHYLAKEMYDIPDEENLIYHCIFKHNKGKASHFYNVICGRIVDSTIMQFDNRTPYDNNDKCYTEPQKQEYSESTIQHEIELYEVRCLYRYKKELDGRTRLCEKNKRVNFERIGILNKIKQFFERKE